MILDQQTISYILGLCGLVGVIFGVYNSYKKPQIKTDQNVIKMREDIDTLQADILEVKEKHLASVESNIKDLGGSVHDLALNVMRLTTIIDERIPKTTK